MRMKKSYTLIAYFVLEQLIWLWVLKTLVHFSFGKSILNLFSFFRFEHFLFSLTLFPCIKDTFLDTRNLWWKHLFAYTALSRIQRICLQNSGFVILLDMPIGIITSQLNITIKVLLKATGLFMDWSSQFSIELFIKVPPIRLSTYFLQCYPTWEILRNDDVRRKKWKNCAFPF